MLFDKKGDIVKDSGKEFVIGMEIKCNDKSDYPGLSGYILEIRDGEDKENDTHDSIEIVCSLNPPEDTAIIAKIEEKFSELFRKPMEIADIDLSYEVLTLEMIDIPGQPFDENDEIVSESESSEETGEQNDLNISADSSDENDEEIDSYDDMENDEVPETSDGSKSEPVEKTDDVKKKEHEESEAKRKKEWEEKQAAKKAAEDKALKEMQVMTDGDVTDASVKKLGLDTERLTRRNMKICVTEHIQTICKENPEFARKAMHPRKNMMNCFKYINKKAQEYLKQEMEENDEKPIGGGYSGDVPDDLCYKWAEDYFNDPDTEIDREKDEKFVPKTYYGGSSSKPNKKVTANVKPTATEKKSDSKNQQLNLFDEGGAA